MLGCAVGLLLGAAAVSELDAYRLPEEPYFPDGLEHVYARTGWRVQAHARYWSAETVYARQNGGAHEFLIDRRSGVDLTNVEQIQLGPSPSFRWHARQTAHSHASQLLRA